MKTLEEQIKDLIDKSLYDNKYVDSVFFPLPDKTAIALKTIMFTNMIGWKCEINSHDIRHANKNHSEDINYICEIPNIVENYTEIKRSVIQNKKTGKTEIAVEFYKKFECETVKVVKIHLRRDKKLRLKTIFVPE